VEFADTRRRARSACPAEPERGGAVAAKPGPRAPARAVMTGRC